ncbi:MAG: hypothetical protein JW797_03620 [Bradymonadales bacterium]|nr:hypothetical protein [Bradymonadales bacterium]
MRLGVIFVLLALAPAWGCQSEEAPSRRVVPESTAPPVEGKLDLGGAGELVVKPQPTAPGDPVSPAPVEPPMPSETWTRPLTGQGTGTGATGREVELRMNGERVRVWRPSLANPFVVAGGEYDAQPAALPPEVGGLEAPRLSQVQPRTIDIIRRVPQVLNLVLEHSLGAGQIWGYLVQFEGYPGHFFVPSELDSEVFGAGAEQRGRVSLGFFMDEVFPPGVRDSQWAARLDQPFDVLMRVWAVDRNRQVSAPVVQQLHVLPVGRGDLEVTLSMSLATDLDLYVVEPNGNVIYYNNMRSWTNGQLDLDANAACRAHTNVRYEHIFWPEGQVPEGTYHIRVDNWANCVGGVPVDYQVIVQNCGEITIYEGTASGPGGRENCLYRYAASCQQIASVEVKPCEEADASAPLPLR